MADRSNSVNSVPVSLFLENAESAHQRAEHARVARRRALWVGLAALVGFAVLTGALGLRGGVVSWPIEAARLILVTAAAAFIYLTARRVDAARTHLQDVVLSARDLVAEVNETSRQLELATTRALDANRAKSAFLARVSHELRRPATTVIGFTQLLELAELSARQQDYVGRIQRAGHDLASLIDEVMDLAEVQSGERHFKLEPIVFDDVLEDVMSGLWPTAADRSVRLVRIGPESTGAVVMADRRGLRRAVYNLIAHVLRYSSSDDQVAVWTELGGAHVRVYARDTGPGVLADPDEDLLSSNFNVEQELIRLQSMGLGLAFAKALTLTFKGKMGADPVIGRATNYWIELPLADSRAIARASAPAGAARASSPQTTTR
ncbi:MAG: HAMP domain-containing sensor histidine kinase [Gemmatimonadota bacterium]